MKKRAAAIICVILVFFIFQPAFAAGNDAFQSANTLYTLGLFKGTGTNSDGTPVYDLDRAPSRYEAITMLVRLLGKENEAQSGNWNTPFRDVAPWAAPYVGYAYANGLTQGTGAAAFGGNETVMASQYLTFVLRALGYSSETDFAWNKAWELSDKLGLTNREHNGTSHFSRGDIAVISCDALSQVKKGSDITLLSSLLASGAVQSDRVEAAGLSGLLHRASLTAKQVAGKASPAVFYIEVYNTDTGLGEAAPIASGSGFFISAEGVAVTNYHVIDRTKAAIATTTDGSEYRIEDVIYYNADRDIAVVRVSREALSGNSIKAFPYLSMMDSSTVSNGDVVYAIGSPLGLQNSITDGIVSNRSRTLSEDSLPFIQISAPISTGSSGGALLNEYGEAIGITSAVSLSGQNVNLAVPLDTIMDLDLTTKGIPYAKIYEGEYKGTVSSVAEYPDVSDVPDFGAYFGIKEKYHDALENGSVFYDYPVKEITGKRSVDQCMDQYSGLLIDRGFSYMYYYTNSDGNTGYRYSNSELRKSVYMDEVIVEGQAYLEILITDDTAKLPVSIVGYQEAQGVPDFGKYAGVGYYAYGTYDEKGLYYDYLAYDILAVDPEGQVVLDYSDLLLNWGFTLSDLSGLKNDDGNTVIVYTNSKAKLQITMSVIVEDGLGMLEIIILPLG